jgi:hypothetical protein
MLQSKETKLPIWLVIVIELATFDVSAGLFRDTIDLAPWVLQSIVVLLLDDHCI